MPKVLVVDDNPDVAALMARTLKDQAYEASVAGNGQSALEMAWPSIPT